MAERRRGPLEWLAALPVCAGRRPGLVLLCVGLVTGLACLALPRLKLQAEIYELFPHRPGPITDLATYGKTFGGQQEVVLLLTGPDPSRVTSASRLVAAELSRSAMIEEVRAGVEGVALAAAIGRSLLLLAGPEAWARMERRLKGPLAPQVARLRRLLLAPVMPNTDALAGDPLGLSELLLERLESNVDRQTGQFVSPDGRAALVFARPVGSPSDEEFNTNLATELKQVWDRVRSRIRGDGIELQFTGSFIYALHFARTLRRDLTLSSLAALVGAVLVLLFFFRSARLLPVAGLTAGLAVCWTLAIAVLAVGSLNVLSLSFAALCIGMGMDALIHVNARTQEFTEESPARRIERAVKALLPALLAASLTSIAAFLSFSLSSFGGLSHTGLLAACGLLFTLLLTLVLAPALGTLFPQRKALTSPGATRLLDRGLRWLAKRLQRRPNVALLAAAVLGIGGLAAASGVRFSADLTRLAPAEFPPVKADLAIARAFERHRHRLIALVRGQDQQQVLEVNDALAGRLRELQRRGKISGFRSLSNLLPSKATQRERRSRLAAINPKAVVERLRDALETGGLDPGAFEPFFSALVRPKELTPQDLPAGLRPLVGRQLSLVGSEWIAASTFYPKPRQDQQALSRALEGLSRPGVVLRVTGAEMAGAQMAALLRHDLLLVSLLSCGVVLVMLWALLRKPWPVIAALLSLLWTGVVFVGCLRLLGLEVDLYNLMVLPVLIGYGVDDHIYVVRRAISDGVGLAVVESGRAVLATTLTSVAAFGALGLCALPGLRMLGATAALGLTLGLVGALVVMPALLGLGARGSRKRGEG